MSCRMDFRRTPESNDWLGSFNCNIRDAIDNECGKVATYEHLGFFQGMAVTASDQGDRKSIRLVIEILKDGGTVDFDITR